MNEKVVWTGVVFRYEDGTVDAVEFPNGVDQFQMRQEFTRDSFMTGAPGFVTLTVRGQGVRSWYAGMTVPDVRVEPLALTSEKGDSADEHDQGH